MDAIYGIPVIGVLFQFIGYLVDVTPGIAPIVVGLAAPIALGAMCGIMNERSGIVNIGIEGMMLSGAFAAFLAAGLFQQAVGGQPPTGSLFDATPALMIGVLAAVATAMALSALHDWHFKMSDTVVQLISGLPDAANPESDAYMTAFAIVLMRQSGVPVKDERIQRGLAWLKREQRVSGRWWMQSLYRGNYSYITYIATAQALKALALCGELEAVGAE